MAERIEKKDGSVTIRFTRWDLVGLSNVINHVLHTGFVIDERDCHTLTGLEWNELHALWKLMKDSLHRVDGSEVMPTSPSQNESIRCESIADTDLAWAFTSSEGRAVYPCGIWMDRSKAEQWIESVGASGTLSAYLVDESAYDSNVRLARLRVEQPERRSPEFKRRYTTAIDHAHYENGRRVG